MDDLKSHERKLLPLRDNAEVGQQRAIAEAPSDCEEMIRNVIKYGQTRASSK